jgi:hypothetical protein
MAAIYYLEYTPGDNINASSSSEGGYVKGLITYMVMDDLEVKPMSTISSITLLTKFNVKDLGSVEEKMVDLGMDEVIYSSHPLLSALQLYISMSTISSITLLTKFNVVVMQREGDGCYILPHPCPNPPHSPQQILGL